LAKTNTWMSWGINSPSNYKDMVLAFKVQWFLLKGWVYISLDYDDTFRVTLTRTNRTTIVKQFKGVYIEDLIGIIDSSIEKDCSDEEYIEKINNMRVVF